MSRNISDLHPTLQAKVAELKALCEKNGLKIGIGECLRTVAEQDALYAQGRTTSGSIVTNAKGSTYSSMHQWGIAFDFYRNDGKGAYYEADGFFNKVGALGVSIGLEWGGNWKSIVDKPHFQLPNWGSTASKLKSTYGNPTIFMRTWQPVVTTESTSVYTKTDFIKDVQRACGATVDGIAGPKTLAATVTVSKTINRKHAVVLPIQKYLYSRGFTSVGTPDGIAGSKFEKAVKEYQANVVGLSCPDGIITAGKASWRKLLGLT